MDSTQNHGISGLSADSLSCRRGGRLVFEGLSFQTSAHSFTAIKGRNGAGKSTFLRLLAGFLPPVDGSVNVDEDGNQRSLEPTDFLLSGHLNGLKPAFTLRQNMDFLCKSMTGSPPDNDYLLEAAEHFGLAELLTEKVQYFSSGQRHRSALMRFALIDRAIWLMDEPTVGLDSENRAALSQLIAQKIANGGIVLAASHDPIEVDGAILNLDDFAPKTPADEFWS